MKPVTFSPTVQILEFDDARIDSNKTRESVEPTKFDPPDLNIHQKRLDAWREQRSKTRDA